MEDQRLISMRMHWVTSSTVKSASAVVCTRVEDIVKKSSGRRVRINMALKNSGKFNPAFVICSKRDRRTFKSSAACLVQTFALVTLWKRLNFPIDLTCQTY